MAKDPAFLFYDGDAARDVSHMNRLERGCYFDLIQAQRKFGGYTVEQVKKILGKDFNNCWEALTLILKQENGIFFIEWVKDSSEKRKENSEKQRLRIQNYWDEKKKESTTTEIPRNNHGYSLENENENTSLKGVQGEEEKNIQSNGYITPKLFDEFWKMYPTKVDKGASLTKWNLVCNRKNPLPPTWKEVRKSLHDQKESARWKDGVIPNPKTWIGQSRWLDDPKEMIAYHFDEEKKKNKHPRFYDDQNTPYDWKEEKQMYISPGGKEWYGAPLKS